MSRKPVEFKGLHSLERLRRLQDLCANSLSVDGILIIGGVDSFHSRVSQAVIKYLFLGGSGQELLGDQVISLEQDRLEEVVLLIRPRGITIFYSSESESAVTILPAIATWRNVTEYVVHDGMDPEELEARKVAAFKSMVADVERIGIPYGVDGGGTSLSDVMIPEKWPLVQSYALDEDGSQGKGFFTMNHSVVNVTSEIASAMAQLDSYASQRLVMESEPMLSYHFDEFLRKLDHSESSDARCKRSEAEVAEDLLSFYAFGTTQYSSRGLEAAPTRGAKVLYGVRSQLLHETPSTTAFPANSGVSVERGATHMLIQAEDPFSGVRFARSYFLATGKVCKRVVDTDALVLQHHDSPADQQSDLPDLTIARDTRLMIVLYASLLRGLNTAVSVVCEQLQETKVINAVLSTVKSIIIDEILVHLKSVDDSDIQMALLECKKNLSNELCVSLEFVDACGQTLATAQSNGWQLMYCSLELRNIMSSDRAIAHTLGSLVIGDSILIQQHSSKTFEHLCVTKGFPYFRSWVGQGKESAAKEALEMALQSDFMLQAPSIQVGKPINPLDMEISINQEMKHNEAVTTASTSTLGTRDLTGAMLMIDSEEMPILYGSMRVFTGGFFFNSVHLNPLLVSFSRHVESVCVVPTPIDDLVLLTFGLKAHTHTRSTPIDEIIPFPTDSSCIRIPLLSGTRFQAEILHALKTWRVTAEGLNIPFYRHHELITQPQFEGETPRDADMKKYTFSEALKDACAELMSKQRESKSNAKLPARFFPTDFIPKDPNPNTSLPKPSPHVLKQHGVPITVMLGVPGSKVDEISRGICNIASSSFEWMQVQINLQVNEKPMATSQNISLEARLRDEVVSGIQSAVSQLAAAADNLQLPPRILISVTGYIDPITVVCAIRQASETTPFPVNISSVIACVSATSVYLPDPLDAQMPFPKLFDQLAAGFTTHILLTNADEVPTGRVNRLRYRIDHCNPFAEVQVLSRQVFEGSITSLLVTNRFESEYYRKYRDTHFPNWEPSSGKKLGYVVGLEPHEVPQTFRFRLAPGMERSNFVDIAVRVLTPFASLGKSLESVHPLSADTTTTKGIRLAQSIAVEKIHLDGTGSDTSSNELFKMKAYPSAWNVEGFVSFDDSPSIIYEYVASGCHARLRKADMAQQKCPLEISITGRGISLGKLQHLLLNCYTRVNPIKLQMRTKQSITIAEKRELQKEHAMDTLPDGYMFDGSNYVDFYGGRYEFHPNMPHIIDEHIAATNEAAGEANAKAERAQKSEQEYVQLIA